MIDFNKFVGIPWKCGAAKMSGADCYGILIMVYKKLFNIEISHFDPAQICNDELTTFKIEQTINSDPRWLLIDEPAVGDAVVMIDRVTGRPDHVGVFIGNSLVLHSLTRNNGSSTVHDFKFLNRIFKRLDFYRYVS